MNVTELALPGVKLIEPTYFEDNRGYSAEAYNDRTLQEYGIKTRFVVDYVCFNKETKTVRGIHFQNNPHPQVKLVRVLHGEVLDFVVDLRRDSPTYKTWTSLTLSGEPQADIFAQRLRSRLCDQSAVHGSTLQVRRLLRQIACARHPLERSGAGARLGR